MSRTYCFEFAGTREKFYDILDQYPNHQHKFYQIEDYIIETNGDSIRFGVERGGHSGGYWYEPTIVETEGKLFFRGKIEYIDFYTKQKGYKKAINKIEEVALFILVLPIVLFFKAYTLIESLIRKLRKKPLTKKRMKINCFTLWKANYTVYKYR